MRLNTYKYTLLLALLLCATSARTFAKDGLTKQHISFGNAALESADYQTAVSHYEEALKEDPKSKSVMYSLGVLYIQTGDTEKAQKLFMDYLEQYPMDKDGLMGLSNVYLMKDEYEKAVRLLSQARSQDKDNEALRRNLGYAQLQAGEIKEARKTLSALVVDCPSNALNRFDLALALAADRDLENALKEAKTGLAIFPDAEGKIIYSELLESVGGDQLDKAVELFRGNEMDKAIAILEPLCAQFPDYSRAQAYLGHCCNLKLPPDRAKAEKAYRVAIAAHRLVPLSRQDLAVVYDNLGSVVLRKGEESEAESYYRLGIAEESDYAPVYFNFGLLRAYKGAYTEASVALMDAVRRDKSMADYIASHPKLAKFRMTEDYTNLLVTIKKEKEEKELKANE